MISKFPNTIVISPRYVLLVISDQITKLRVLVMELLLVFGWDQSFVKIMTHDYIP